MSSKPSTSDRKRKAREEPEAVVNSNDQVRKQSTTRRPHTRASGLNVEPVMDDATERASGLNVEPVMDDATERASGLNVEPTMDDATERALGLNVEPTMDDATERDPTADAVSAYKNEEEIQIVGKLIKCLLHSDKKRVEASLDALQLRLDDGQKKKEHIQAVGGCYVLVQLIENCLEVVGANGGAKGECDKVTELSELDGLETLEAVLDVIANLTYQDYDSKVGITAIGGVKAVVKVMSTFPACRQLQLAAADTLGNLTCCDSGEKSAVQADGIKFLLAAVSNHLNSDSVIKKAFDTLHRLIVNSEDNTKEFILCGGSAVVLKVREHWLDRDQNVEVQTCVRALTEVMMEDMTNRMKEDKEKD
jgi:hypothetical protein